MLDRSLLDTTALAKKRELMCRTFCFHHRCKGASQNNTSGCKGCGALASHNKVIPDSDSSLAGGGQVPAEEDLVLPGCQGAPAQQLAAPECAQCLQRLLPNSGRVLIRGCHLLSMRHITISVMHTDV